MKTTWQSKPYFIEGQWNVICDRCGRKRKSAECRLEWTGLFVCSDTCWEIRHPSDLIKVPKDLQQVPIARPEQPDNVTIGDITNQNDG